MYIRRSRSRSQILARHEFVHGRSQRTIRDLDALAAEGRTIHRRAKIGLASAILAGPSAFSVFKVALSACHLHASLTDEAEGQSGDARIDHTGEPVRSYRRQADLHLYAVRNATLCRVVLS